PSSGFGLNLVRLLVEQYNGAVETTVSEEGTTVEVVLGRAGGNAPPVSNPVDVRSYGVGLEQIVVAIAASLLAGGVMGIVIQTVAGVVPVIGALYGAMDPLVGWITHEFHSVVFGLIYAGIVAIVPARYGDRALGRVGIGILWALSLSLIAAGFVMPVWLRLVGLPAPLPSFNPASVAGHSIWGIVLGGSYHVGLRWLDSRPVE
ncbi:MAG: sensor histidine kinase, partial [Halobacteriales archaeon]|nr:sensor histidine kinase [Halobacteriales archaeon]